MSRGGQLPRTASGPQRPASHVGGPGVHVKLENRVPLNTKSKNGNKRRRRAVPRPGISPASEHGRLPLLGPRSAVCARGSAPGQNQGHSAFLTPQEVGGRRFVLGAVEGAAEGPAPLAARPRVLGLEFSFPWLQNGSCASEPPSSHQAQIGHRGARGKRPQPGCHCVCPLLRAHQHLS